MRMSVEPATSPVCSVLPTGPRASLRVGSGSGTALSLMCRAVVAREASAMIEIDDLTVRYGGFTAVDHVSFTARTGRVTGFLGPNGAGKSTTMRVMVGLT